MILPPAIDKLPSEKKKAWRKEFEKALLKYGELTDYDFLCGQAAWHAIQKSTKRQRY